MTKKEFKKQYRQARIYLYHIEKTLKDINFFLELSIFINNFDKGTKILFIRELKKENTLKKRFLEFKSNKKAKLYFPEKICECTIDKQCYSCKRNNKFV